MQSACNAGDGGSVPGSGRSPGEGNGNPLQSSCLEKPMDGGAWRATVHGVAESGTTEQLILLTFHIRLDTCQKVWVFFVASSFAGIVQFSYIPAGSEPLEVHLARGLENGEIFWLQKYDLHSNSLSAFWLQNNAARVTAKWRVSPLDPVSSVTILT